MSVECLLLIFCSLVFFRIMHKTEGDVPGCIHWLEVFYEGE